MKKILILLATVLAVASCDIDRLPYGSMSSDQVDPENQFTQLVNGSYAQLKSWSDPMHRCGEYAGDNITKDKHSTDAFFEFISFNRSPNNYRLDQFWNSGWKAIAQASNVIKMGQEGQSEEVDYQIGECYYIRGLCYFYFVRAYGRPFYQAPDKNLGVPIVNGTPDDVTNMFLGDRATVRQTYQQVIDDLTKAAALMKSGKTDHSGPAYASTEAAWALLSRVYLYMSGTYDNPNREYAQKCVDYSDSVINSGKYELLPRDQFMKYNEYTPENNKESIFVVKRVASEFSGYDHYYGIGGMYCFAGEMGWAEIFASAKYLNLLDETGRNDWRPGHKKIVDARANFIDPQYSEDDEGNYTEVFRFIKKAYNSAGAQSGYTYVQAPITRAADGSITCTEGDNTFRLTVVDADEEKYSVAYSDGETYTGYIDYKMKDNVGHPQFYINKCSYEGVASGEQPSQLYSPLISRLGEIYLNRAEAYAKLGQYDLALADLNLIRERSIVGGGYPTLDATTAPERIDKERQLELAFQAERSYDVFRNGGTLTRHYPGTQDAMLEVPATDFRVIYYIPQNAINAYPGTLTQNPTSQAGVVLN